MFTGLTASKGYCKMEDRSGNRETQVLAPRQSNAVQLLLTVGSQQHRLQPWDTPNMEQQQSLALAGILQGEPFMDRISTAGVSPEALSVFLIGFRPNKVQDLGIQNRVKAAAKISSATSNCV